MNCWSNELDTQGLNAKDQCWWPDTPTECLVCQESECKMVLKQAFQIVDQKKLIIQCLFPSRVWPTLVKVNFQTAKLLLCRPYTLKIHTRHVQKKTKLLLQRLYCSFYSILSTVPFKVVPSTGDTPLPMFLPCSLEHTFCDDAQFSYRIFLNLLYGLETTSFQSGFKSGKQEKVCWG